MSDNGESYKTVLSKLGDNPSLLEIVELLTDGTDVEKRVAGAKALRNSKLTSEESFFLVAHTILEIAERRINQAKATTLKPVNDRIDSIKKAHGLTDDDDWPLGEGPPEYQELLAEWDRITDGITAQTFVDYGEQELATMYLNDRATFDRLFKLGHRSFFRRK